MSVAGTTELPPGGQLPATPGFLGVLLRAVGLLAALGLVAVLGFHRTESPESAAPRASLPPTAQVPETAQAASPETEPLTVAEPTPPPPEPAAGNRPLDRAAIARAEDDLDSATRDRARAEDRAAQVDAGLVSAQLGLSRQMGAYRSLTRQLRDPTARIERAQARTKVVAADLAQLRSELAAISKAPRPQAKLLLDQSPVARPPAGDESHFEVRAGRVSYVDIDTLLDRLKTDARIQLRLMSSPGPISGVVGPVGTFSIRYQMTPTGLGLDGEGGGSSRLSASYGLTGWEIIPTQKLRGETYEQARSPASDFARATTRLDPQRDAITMWVYPDGFELYRALRDLLHQRGFLVSARPLPADMPIRGSPVGSVSAAQ
jgi:hypothetical protein